MTDRELSELERLLKKFRAEYSWDPREKPGGRLEHAPSVALRAVRSIRNEGPFYRKDSEVRISKKDAARLAELRKLIESRRNQVLSDASQVARNISCAVAPVNRAIRSLNEAVGQLNTLIERVGSELADAYDEKSDKWRDSDAGMAAAQMVESWAGVIDAVPMVEVLEPDLPDLKKLMTEVYSLEEESDT